MALEEPTHGEQFEPGSAPQTRPPQRLPISIVKALAQGRKHPGVPGALQARPRLGESLHGLVPEVLFLQTQMPVLALRPRDVLLAHVGLLGVYLLTLGDDLVRGWAVSRLDFGLRCRYHGRRDDEQPGEQSVAVIVAVEGPALVAVLEVLASGRVPRIATKHAVKRGVQAYERRVSHTSASVPVVLVRPWGRTKSKKLVSSCTGKLVTRWK